MYSLDEEPSSSDAGISSPRSAAPAFMMLHTPRRTLGFLWGMPLVLCPQQDIQNAFALEGYGHFF